MPRLEIPSYNSRESIQPIQQAPLMKGESLQPFKDMEMVLSTGKSIVAEWQKAEAVMQVTEAKTGFKMSVARLYQQAQEDPDFESSEKYKKAIAKAKKEELDKVSSNQLKNKLALEFEYDSQATMFKIENDFRKKKIAKNEVVFGNAYQAYVSNRINYNKDSLEYRKNEEDFTNMIKAQKESHLLSEEQIKEIDKKANKSVAEALVYIDPERARDAIQSGAFNLDEKEKYQLIESSYRVQKAEKEREKYIQKQIKLTVLNELSEKLINNELSFQEVQELQSNDAISPEEASIFAGVALKKDYEIPPSTQTAEADYFLKLLDDASGEKELQNKIFSDAAKAYSDGIIGKNQYRFFVQEARKTLERQQKGSFLKSLGGFFSSVKNAMFSMGKDEKQQFMEDVTGEVAGKDVDDPEVVNQAILKAKAKNNPAYRVFLNKKVGDMVTLPDGTTVKFNGVSEGDIDIEVIK